MPTDKPSKAGDEALLEQARKRFRTAANAEEKRRRRQLFDYKFSIGKFGPGPKDTYQWDDEAQSLREGRITLTNNRVGPQCRQTVNQIRQAKQAIKAIPIDGGADRKKADIRQGVFRCIESKSKALVAYMIATDHQVRMGEGFVRVVPQYVANGPTQELVIKAVRNRFSVYADPKNLELDGSDWRYLFITEDLENGEGGEYDERYGGISKQAVGLSSFEGYGDNVAEWFQDGHVRIAEYFFVKSTWRTETIKGQPRKLETKTVHWVLMNGIEILDRRELPIPWIPVVRFVGEVTDIEGEVDYRGAVTDAIDPQKYVNYIESATAEAVGLAPKAPYIGYAPSFAGFEKIWETANTKNWSYLPANFTDPQNKQLGPMPLPQRNITSPEIQGLVLAGQRGENNLRAALGVNDVDANERTKEQSGKAINARQRQNDLTNNHFGDHHALGVQQVGRILDKWVPFIYDSPRVMQIMGADERPQQVMVHAGMPPAQAPDGVDVFDLKVGNYDIDIQPGPSQTRQDEVSELIGQIIAANPQLINIIGDVFFGNLPTAEAKQIGERLKKMLPKELQDKEEGAPEIPPEVQQQMQAMGQQVELLAKELEARTQQVEQQEAKAAADLQAKQAAIQSNEAIKQAEIASEETIAAAKLRQEFELALMKMDHEEKLAQYKAQQAERQMQHQAVEGDRERMHESERADMDLRSQADQAEAGREHEASMTERTGDD